VYANRAECLRGGGVGGSPLGSNTCSNVGSNVVSSASFRSVALLCLVSFVAGLGAVAVWGNFVVNCCKVCKAVVVAWGFVVNCVCPWLATKVAQSVVAL
jgi:hypothetical protein